MRALRSCDRAVFRRSKAQGIYYGQLLTRGTPPILAFAYRGVKLGPGCVIAATPPRGPMRFGAILPNLGQLGNRPALTALGRRAEESRLMEQLAQQDRPLF